MRSTSTSIARVLIIAAICSSDLACASTKCSKALVAADCSCGRRQAAHSDWRTCVVVQYERHMRGCRRCVFAHRSQCGWACVVQGQQLRRLDGYGYGEADQTEWEEGAVPEGKETG